MPELHYQFPLMRPNLVRTAAKIGERIMDCTARHVFFRYEQNTAGIPFEMEGSTICLRHSFYEAYCFTRASKRAKWDVEDIAWAQMHLSMRKAESLLSQLAVRGMAVEQLAPDEIACYAVVMADAVAAASKALRLSAPGADLGTRASRALSPPP
ncbi:hypothetical protein [Bradyrhizobium sp. 930_D9_N1_4]|uniref:hypothetical protein n=1 Tax=Bradyrhizobium sp. 930_D9_N1_4 TaxID=3240374 RepID=UPI003F8949FE